MSELLRAGTSLAAVAVDTLAAGLITNSLGASVVRQSGKIDDHVTYGFLFTAAAAQLPAQVAGNPNPNGQMQLAQCLDALVRTGPMKYSKLTYFRQYASELAFSQNSDLVDRQEQEDVARAAMVQSAYILPLSTLGFLLFAFYFDRSWDRYWGKLRDLPSADTASSEPSSDRAGLTAPNQAAVGTRQPAATVRPHYPSASRLPPMSGGANDDDDDD